MRYQCFVTSNSNNDDSTYFDLVGRNSRGIFRLFFMWCQQMYPFCNIRSNSSINQLPLEMFIFNPYTGSVSFRIFWVGSNTEEFRCIHFFLYIPIHSTVIAQLLQQTFIVRSAHIVVAYFCTFCLHNYSEEVKFSLQFKKCYRIFLLS